LFRLYWKEYKADKEDSQGYLLFRQNGGSSVNRNECEKLSNLGDQFFIMEMIVDYVSEENI